MLCIICNLNGTKMIVKVAFVVVILVPMVAPIAIIIIVPIVLVAINVNVDNVWSTICSSSRMNSSISGRGLIINYII